jgi:hypothetical protein
MRALFAEGVEKMYIPWAVEGLPTLVHLSVFLFLGGLVIFLFNVDHWVFSSVIWWIVLFSIVYGLITVMPIVRYNSPYCAPLSRPAWFLYAGMVYVFLEVLVSRSSTFESWRDLKDRYHRWMLGGVEKAAEEMMSERSSEIDIRIFHWTIGVLGDDESLEKFFEAIPGFFSSRLVKHLERDFPEDTLKKFWSALNGFMNRTLSSNSVVESVKTRRVTICRDIMSTIPYPFVSNERLQVTELIYDALGDEGLWEKLFEAVPGFLGSELVNGPKELPDEFRIKFSQALSGFMDRTFSLSSVTESVRSGRLVICLNAARAALGFDGVSQILWNILSRRWPEVLQSVEMGYSLQCWANRNDKRFAQDVQRIVAQIVVGVRERDGRWISLVEAEYDIEGHVLRDYIGHDDSVLLSILIHTTRQAFYTGSWTPWALSSLSEFDIRDTSPELQHAFCALWNAIVLKARNEEGPTNISIRILRDLRHAYLALHQDADAEFSASTNHFDPVLRQPQSYPLCDVASHVTISLTIPHLTQLDPSPVASPPHLSPIEGGLTPDGSIASQQAEEANVIAESPDYTPDPSDTQEFTCPPLATNSAYITHTTFIPDHSVPEGIGPAITSDPDLLVPDEASAPSAAEIAATDSVWLGDRTPQTHTSESGESSLALATPLIFEHPDLVPATIAPSTGSSCFVPYPRDNPDAILQDTTSSAALSHPLEGNRRQYKDAILSCATSDISEIPYTVYPIPWPITVSPNTVISDSQLSPPALSSSMTTAVSPSSVEFPQIQIPPALRSSSSSLTTASSYISPQVASALDARVASRIGTPSPHDDIHDLNPPIPMTLLPHLNQLAPPPPCHLRTRYR